MKKIEIFGKKVPLFAILIVIMVIGTASAAVFYNYATLTGEIEVTNSISVSDHNTSPIALGGDGELIFTSPATFVINNNGDEPVVVDLVTTLFLDTVEVTDETGLTVDYSVIDGTDVERGMVLVPPGGLTIDVEFDAVDNAVPGTYTVQVEVNYSAIPYDEFDGDNELQSLLLLQKNETWVPTGNETEVNFASMGNHFYYELSSDDLEPETEYTLIYYADKSPDRFAPDAWGGNNPGAIICTVTSDDEGYGATSGDIELDMSLPHPDDANAYFYDYSEEFGTAHGAKLWLVPSSNINEDFDEYIRVVAEWIPAPIFMENDLINYIDTDL